MKITGLRWLMVGLIFLVTVVNYIDRQTVSVLKTSISQDLGLSNAHYAAIQNSIIHSILFVSPQRKAPLLHGASLAPRRATYFWFC